MRFTFLSPTVSTQPSSPPAPVLTSKVAPRLFLVSSSITVHSLRRSFKTYFRWSVPSLKPVTFHFHKVKLKSLTMVWDPMTWPDLPFLSPFAHHFLSKVFPWILEPAVVPTWLPSSHGPSLSSARAHLFLPCRWQLKCHLLRGLPWPLV